MLFNVPIEGSIGVVLHEDTMLEPRGHFVVFQVYALEISGDIERVVGSQQFEHRLLLFNVRTISIA